MSDAFQWHDMWHSILVTSPRPDAVLKTPVVVQGEARGFLFNDGAFSARIVDSDGHVLGETVVRAEGEIDEDALVPFATEIGFDVGVSTEGELVFRKGDEDVLRMSVRL